MPGFASGNDAVKSVYPFFHPDKNIFDGADAQKMPWFVFRQAGQRPAQNFSHLLFSERSADAKAVKRKRADKRGAFSSQIFKNTSLRDAIKRLSVFLFCAQTLFSPSVSLEQRFFVVIVAVKRRGALIKSENYIRPQIFLDFYGNFRVKLVFLSVIRKNNSTPSNLDRKNDIGCRWTTDERRVG